MCGLLASLEVPPGIGQAPSVVDVDLCILSFTSDVIVEVFPNDSMSAANVEPVSAVISSVRRSAKDRSLWCLGRSCRLLRYIESSNKRVSSMNAAMTHKSRPTKQKSLLIS
jgi:hypothetical protein